jgi:hypothetical protein
MDTGVDQRSGLTLVRDVVRIGCDDRPLRRENAAGTVRRIRRGAYADAAQWNTLKPRDRYLVRVLAVVGTRRRMPVLAFDSAAAVWGYPRFEAWPGAWPGVVHVIAPSTSGIRSRNGVVVHRDQLEPEDVVEVDGLLVTSPQRTLVDLARIAAPGLSVSAVDSALNPTRNTAETRVTKLQLEAALERVESPRGVRKARHVIRFADGLADNPGESVSRVLIFELDFPTPSLQLRHVNPRGGFYFTDFEWPEYNAIGELDGLGKYTKEEYLGRMSPGDAVVEEKIREDHLRAEHNAFARWTPDDLRQPARLRRILAQAGLPSHAATVTFAVEGYRWNRHSRPEM